MFEISKCIPLWPFLLAVLVGANGCSTAVESMTGATANGGSKDVDGQASPSSDGSFGTGGSSGSATHDASGNAETSGNSPGMAAACAGFFDSPAGAPATPGVLDGLWGASLAAGNNAVDGRLDFAGSLMTVAVRCRFMDSTIMFACVASAIRVDSTRITYLEAKSVHEVAGAHSCDANVDTGQNAYAIDGLGLTITGTGGSSTWVKIHD